MKDFPFTFSTLSLKEECSDPASAYFLWLVLSGELFYDGDFGPCTLKSSSVIFIRAGEVGHVVPSGSNLILALRINSDFFSENIDENKHPIFCNSELRPGSYDELRRNISLAANAYHNSAVHDRLYIFSLVYSLLHTLYRQFALTSENSAQFERQWNSERRAALERYIRRNYREPLALADLSDEFHISYQYLSKYFKSTFGVNFLTYLRDIRLQCAFHDMRNGKSATASAVENGFSSISAFNRAFKEKYGSSPTVYFQAGADGSTTALSTTAYSTHDFSESEDYISQYISASVPASSADLTERISCSIDCASHTQITHSWARILNLEDYENCLDHSFQEQVRLVQSEIGFAYGHIKGVLYSSAKSTSIAKGLFDIILLTNAINFLISVGLAPFIELGPRHDDTVTIPIARFENALEEMILYCIRRWGEDEVEKWRFSLSFMNDGCCSDQQINQFCRYFRVAGSVIHRHIPTGRLGGFGLDISSPAQERLFAQMKSLNIAPDFFSATVFPLHHKSSSENSTGADYLVFGSESTVSGRIDNVIRSFHEVFPDVRDIYLTEFSSAERPLSPLNETEYKAASIVRMIIDSFDKATCMGYWQLSDLSNIHVNNNLILFGGAGMMTRNGIRKNTYHIFKLLAEMGTSLISRGSNYMITTRNRYHIEILIHNCKNLSAQYCSSYHSDQELPPNSQLYEDSSPLEMHFTLANARKSSYLMKIYSLNEEHGNISKVIRDFNCNEMLRKNENDYLIGICVPKQTVEYGKSGGTIDLNFTLDPNEVKLICLNFD